LFKLYFETPLMAAATHSPGYKMTSPAKQKDTDEEKAFHHLSLWLNSKTQKAEKVSALQAFYKRAAEFIGLDIGSGYGSSRISREGSPWVQRQNFANRNVPSNRFGSSPLRKQQFSPGKVAADGLIKSTVISDEIEMDPLTQSSITVYKSYEAMGLNKDLIKGLNDYAKEKENAKTLDGTKLGRVTPIEKRVIVPVIQGRDIVARTSRNTTAFDDAAFHEKSKLLAVSALGRLLALNEQEKNGKTPERTPAGGGGCKVLIIVPTKKLAVLTYGTIQTIGSSLGDNQLHLWHLCVGCSRKDKNMMQMIEDQKKALMDGVVQLVVGTPGRLMDLCRRKVLDLSNLRTIMMDGACDLLRPAATSENDRGKGGSKEFNFRDQVEEVFKGIPFNKPDFQRVVFIKRPINEAVEEFAAQRMKKPLRIKLNLSSKNKIPPRINPSTPLKQVSTPDWAKSPEENPNKDTPTRFTPQKSSARKSWSSKRIGHLNPKEWESPERRSEQLEKKWNKMLQDATDNPVVIPEDTREAEAERRKGSMILRAPVSGCQQNMFPFQYDNFWLYKQHAIEAFQDDPTFESNEQRKLYRSVRGQGLTIENHLAVLGKVIQKDNDNAQTNEQVATPVRLDPPVEQTAVKEIPIPKGEWSTEEVTEEKKLQECYREA